MCTQDYAAKDADPARDLWVVRVADVPGEGAEEGLWVWGLGSGV